MRFNCFTFIPDFGRLSVRERTDRESTNLLHGIRFDYVRDLQQHLAQRQVVSNFDLLKGIQKE